MVHFPGLDGATGWLNSPQLTAGDLRGKVLLVDFWTYTCINWLRTEPYIRAWSRAYREDGLVVVGVHTPEFSFEHEIDRVRQAVSDMDIDYPIALDSDYAIWNAFDNHYWPAAYFVDRDGIIRDQHFGEGRYEQSERTLQDLLGIDRPLAQVEGVGVEAEADWDNLRSPETYLGYARGDRPASDENLRLNQWRLTGDWARAAENIVLEQPGGAIAFRFQARDAHLVLSHATPQSIPFRVLLDGEAPGPSHGLDVNEEGDGFIDEARLYQLVREDGEVRERTLEIAFAEPGVRAYVFTFG